MAEWYLYIHTRTDVELPSGTRRGAQISRTNAKHIEYMCVCVGAQWGCTIIIYYGGS